VEDNRDPSWGSDAGLTRNLTKRPKGDADGNRPRSFLLSHSEGEEVYWGGVYKEHLKNCGRA